MQRSSWVVSMTAICFLLGLLLVVQFRSAGPAASAVTTSGEQAAVLGSLVERNAALRAEIAELENQIARLGPPGSREGIEAMTAELARLSVVSGTAPVTGPGIRLGISGAISALDMQDLINELRNAGAEAIALDSRRIIMRSVVARNGTGLSLDGVRLSAPYVLEAIGHPETIEKAILRKGGLITLLEYAYPGLSITVTRVENLSLPAYGGRYEFKYAQPLPE